MITGWLMIEMVVHGHVVTRGHPGYRAYPWIGIVSFIFQLSYIYKVSYSSSVQLNSNNVQDTLHHNELVFVNFYADWWAGYFYLFMPFLDAFSHLCYALICLGSSVCRFVTYLAKPGNLVLSCYHLKISVTKRCKLGLKCLQARTLLLCYYISAVLYVYV